AAKRTRRARACPLAVALAGRLRSSERGGAPRVLPRERATAGPSGCRSRSRERRSRPPGDAADAGDVPRAKPRLLERRGGPTVAGPVSFSNRRVIDACLLSSGTTTAMAAQI